MKKNKHLNKTEMYDVLKLTSTEAIESALAHKVPLFSDDKGVYTYQEEAQNVGIGSYVVEILTAEANEGTYPYPRKKMFPR